MVRRKRGRYRNFMQSREGWWTIWADGERMHMHFARSRFRCSLIMGIHVTATFTHIAGTKQTLLWFDPKTSVSVVLVVRCVGTLILGRVGPPDGSWWFQSNCSCPNESVGFDVRRFRPIKTNCYWKAVLGLQSSALGLRSSVFGLRS